tara:strand:- start:127752 stop:127898 length:147 start_codon:yes stop_codon:yes gene_type:complete
VLLAGVVQWQNESFPSFRHGFDSRHPLQIFLPEKYLNIFVTAATAAGT